MHALHAAWALLMGLVAWLRVLFTRPHSKVPLPSWAGEALTGVVAVDAAVRGLDLVMHAPAPTTLTPEGDAYATPTATLDLLGAEVWGTGLLVASVILVLALVTRRLGGYLLGHIAGVAVYSGYMIAIMQGVWFSPLPGGWRFVATAMTLWGVHMVRLVGLLDDVRKGGDAADLARREDRR